ncbi:MAG TPA: hypothetical protein VF815_40080 [Myxococcaceae bacterium]|jgi:hypothetical protein
MNIKPWVAAGAALVVGCAPMQAERRVEKGPVLRTYAKEEVLGQRRLAADVEARWPKLTMRFISSDVCRTEQREEYVENVITETYEPSAAPATSAGAANTAVGLGLLLARPLFSNEPDRDAIDREGRYGASSRKVATGWGIALVSLGVPSLVTGIVQMMRSGEETETRKAESVVSLREEACHPKPATGTLEFAGGAGAPPTPRTITDGTLELTEEELRTMSFAGVLIDGEPAAMSDEDQELVSNFRLCSRVLAEPMDAASLAKEDVGHLQVLRKRVVGCKEIPGAPVEDRLRLLDAALAAHGSSAVPPDEPEINSFEDAVAAHKPGLTLSADSEELSKLENAETLRGQAVVLRGILERLEEQNIAVVRVGDVRVLVFLDEERKWASDFPKGSRVELVGVVMGQQQLGDLEAPLVRALWMRPAL